MPNLIQTFLTHEARKEKREPHLSHPIATAYITLSVLIMCFAALFEVLPILVFFALWLPLIAIKGTKLLAPSWDALLIFSIPLLCITSTAWSAYPSTTLYLGTAFLALVTCILIIARTVPFKALISGLTYGISITLIITLNQPSESPDLTGLFGSKNGVGFISQLGILAACFQFFLMPTLFKKITRALLPLLLALTCLILSHSGTALLSCIVALSTALFAYAISRTAPHLRWLTLTLGGAVAAILIISAILFNAQSLLLSTLGKSSTYTGRTYLWEEGIKAAAEQPILGRGYSAFWVHGQPQAERYWREFYVERRSGFHFHNVYIQATVDLGILGLATITLLILSNTILSFASLLRHNLCAERIFLTSLSAMFLIRSIVEIDFFVGPFGMGALLFYMILPRLKQSNNTQPTASNLHSATKPSTHEQTNQPRTIEDEKNRSR